MGGGSSHTKLNHKKNIGKNTKIGVHRAVDDSSYDAVTSRILKHQLVVTLAQGDDNKSKM